MRIVLAGGGTGGHVLPLLSVAKELKKQRPDAELYYIGGRSGLEREIMDGANIKSVYIHAGKWRRYGTGWVRKVLDLPTNAQNAVDLFKFAAGFTQSYTILRRIKPDLVFIKGGYVGLPVGLAAAALSIPFAIHESDTVPGLTNRILAKYAQVIFVAFPTVWNLPKEKLLHTGIPVRADIGTIGREAAAEFFGFSSALPTVFVFGGSQGARPINTVLSKIIDRLVMRAQVVHATGEPDSYAMKKVRDGLPAELQGRYRPFDFLKSEMPYAYAAADVVVSRAGANTIFEIAAASRASILIPLPHSAGDHQLKNAQIIAREGAARVILEADLTPERLESEITELLRDAAARASLAKSAHALFDAKSAWRIAVQLLNLARRSR